MDVTHAIKRSTHYGNSYLDGHRVHNAFVNRNLLSIQGQLEDS